MKKQPATAFAVILIGVSAATMTVVTSVGAQPGPPCTGTNQCVDVTIAGGAIQSVANVVVLGSNHQIYWRIKTSGYSFPSSPSGITFKQPSPINDNGRMPANEFPCNRVSATLFHCTDANSTHGAGVRNYQYAISVVDASGRRVVSDPWIVNR
jgi:hypothetical protein